MSNPQTMNEYLKQLAAEMRGQDPALIHDALYDAEEFFTAEQENGAKAADEPSDSFQQLVSRYGNPREVATAYIHDHAKLPRATTKKKAEKPKKTLRGLVSIFADGRVYGQLLYLILMLPLSVLYFTVVVTGISVSLGLLVTIIGVPFFFLFLGGVRFFALAEGKIIQALVGVQMPKNPYHAPAAVGMRNKLIASLKDRKSWTAMFYFLVSLPIAVVLFSVTVTLLSTSLALIAAFPFRLGGWLQLYSYPATDGWHPPDWSLPAISLVGIALLIGTFYLVRFFSLMQAAWAKKTLVTRFTAMLER